MKKSLLALLMSAALVSSIGCSNWNKVTPKPLDNTAMEEEIRKSLAGDHITGLSIDVNSGVVTLKGHLSAADKQKVHGQANPLLTGSIDGIKNGDGISASYATAATQASSVGMYDITSLE